MVYIRHVPPVAQLEAHRQPAPHRHAAGRGDNAGRHARPAQRPLKLHHLLARAKRRNTELFVHGFYLLSHTIGYTAGAIQVPKPPRGR